MTESYYRSFRKEPSLPAPWNTWSSAEVSEDNIEFNQGGVSFWCRDGKGATAMLVMPERYGTWTVRSRITEGPTKICLLLWPKKGDAWPPEIDFNESGDRTRSNQTLHYGKVVNGKHGQYHTFYAADQTRWHNYGVRVTPEQVIYLLDGVIQHAIPNVVPTQEWNLHLRTMPNGHSEETRMDVWSVRYVEPAA